MNTFQSYVCRLICLGFTKLRTAKLLQMTKMPVFTNNIQLSHKIFFRKKNPSRPSLKEVLIFLHSCLTLCVCSRRLSWARANREGSVSSVWLGKQER